MRITTGLYGILLRFFKCIRDKIKYISCNEESMRKGLFTWREGAPANRATLGGLTFDTFSLENALKRLQARQGSLPTRGTLSSCSGYTARRDSFLPCKSFVSEYPGWPR